MKATCSRCKQTKPISQLNGYNPITGDTSRAYCVRIAECNSASAQRSLKHLTALLEAAKQYKDSFMSDDTKKYLSNTQQRGFKTLKALFGHEVTGISSNDLARQLDHSNSQTYKDLVNLQESGLAEQLPNKNWRVSTALGRESLRIVNHINAMKTRLDETAERFGVNDLSKSALERYGLNS